MNYILFHLNDKLYVRDPQKSAVGQAILQNSIEIIDQIGFEMLTFRKLAERMNSTEATIYRYFENKFRLLQYLVDWYWAIMNFEINFQTNNVKTAEDKLRICLQLLAGTKDFIHVSTIEAKALQRIVIAESDKMYLSRSIDEDYQNGLFDPFNNTCKLIAGIVKAINPKYPFAHSLTSTAMNAAKDQVYFAKHIPSVSDIRNGGKNMNERLYQFLEGFVINALKH